MADDTHETISGQPSFPRWGVHQSGQRRLFQSLDELAEAGAGWCCLADPDQTMRCLIYATRPITLNDYAVASGEIREALIPGGPIDFFLPVAPNATTAYQHRQTGRWFVDKKTRAWYAQIFRKRDERPWRMQLIFIGGTDPLPPGFPRLTILQALEQQLIAVWWPFKDVERRIRTGEWAPDGEAFLRAQQELPPQV